MTKSFKQHMRLLYLALQLVHNIKLSHARHHLP
jgi:hypothetical protein